MSRVAPDDTVLNGFFETGSDLQKFPSTLVVKCVVGGDCVDVGACLSLLDIRVFGGVP